MAKHNEYDEEPVVYCAKCYSLKIRHEDNMDCDYCMDCGSTETKTASIEDWERLYEGRYGEKFVKVSNSRRDSKYFGMTVGELKKAVYDRRDFREVMERLYPGFPRGLSISESVIVLFGRLERDRRLDELKFLLSDLDREKESKDNNKK